MRTDSSVNELETLVIKAVKTSTKGFRPFTVCLSGGVDSSMLVALLTKIGMKPALTVTMANSEEHPDYKAAKLVADIFDLKWQPIILKQPVEIVDGQSRLHVIDGDDAVFTLYSHLAKLEVKNVLCTDGIDELTGGYIGHRAEQDFAHYLGRLWSCHVEPLLASAQHRGIRLRFPYLDYRLTDFITRLPIELKTNGDNRKVIWRRLALRYLPEEIIYRRKYGQCSMLNWKPEH